MLVCNLFTACWCRFPEKKGEPIAKKDEWRRLLHTHLEESLVIRHNLRWIDHFKNTHLAHFFLSLVEGYGAKAISLDLTPSSYYYYSLIWWMHVAISR